LRPEVEVWWRQAQADLETARVTRDAGRQYAASWFAQQAVEKALKALHIEQRGRLAPRTHDLEYLGREIGAPAIVSADLALLNPAFNLVRYPDPITGRAPVDEVTPEQAANQLAAAERVLEWINHCCN
jgi:HEPN domain-containing protein